MGIIALLLILIFFVLSAFFSGIETGLISIDRFMMEKKSRTDSRKKQILDFMNNPDRLFGTTLFGTNISVVIVSSLATYLFKEYDKYLDFIPDNYLSLMLAFLILIFAELIPKAVFRENANALVTTFFPPLRFFSLIFKPFVKFVAVINNSLAKIFKLPSQPGYQYLTREDISLMLQETQNDDTLQEDQREMLEDALEFTELKAENVMIHRTEVIAIQQDMSMDDVIQIAKEHGYTRFPVYKDSLDEIVGILIIYELLKSSNTGEGLKAKDLIRKPFFAPETMDVSKLLATMQSQKVSMAIIVDSWGGTAGLITIEDILEEIVGEIEDEYDTTSEEVQVVAENTYIIQGYVEIDYLNDDFDMNLPEGDYETLAGLLIHKMAKIPARKAKLTVNKWIFEILEATNTKILKVKATLKDNQPTTTSLKNES